MRNFESAIGITRRYLHDEVADRLRDLILSGELVPTSRINEAELCARFGTSRTPLREAIKILATEGFLDLLPNRGARVATISLAEIEEMVEVVAGLEATAAELACRRITEKEIAAIQVDHNAMLAAWKARDEIAYFELNRAIHEAVMAASRNTTLIQIYAGISKRIQTMRYRAHKTEAQWIRAIGEHERMLALLIARDGDKLAQLMKDHLRGKKEPIAAAYGEALEIA
ncbi:MAG: GntR family transcriptional regulator [Hyphomicrobiales bacterium]|nr:GntR family transcriptional regulator [Hyphomicrobiales bacterium]OQW81772.1 MAG: GntR family transcriptional regulator [Proteobacteria bacterium ST_bin15]